MRLAAAPVVMALALLVDCGGNDRSVDGATDVDRTAYARAQRAYAAGNLQEARRLLDQQLAADPQFLQARLLLGKTALLAGSLADAERTFRELVAEAPQYRDARLWWLRALIAQDRLAAARSELHSLLTWDPDDPRLLLLQAEVAAASGATAEVIGLYERAATFADDLARGALTVARSHYADGDLRPAQLALEEALRLASPHGVLREAIARLDAAIGPATDAATSRAGG